MEAVAARAEVPPSCFDASVGICQRRKFVDDDDDDDDDDEYDDDDDDKHIYRNYIYIYTHIFGKIIFPRFLLFF